MFSPLTTSAIRRLGCWLSLLGLAVSPAARGQTTDDGFDPNVDGNVYAVAMQPNGKLIVGGGFLHVQPNASGSPVFLGRLARLNANGSLDASFGPFFNGDVTSLAVQADGKVLVAGKFTNVLPLGAASPVERNGLARLNEDGSLDTSFDPHPAGTGIAPTALVRAMAVQADGRIIIAGGFTSLQPGRTGSPITRHRIARLNANGTVDPTFDPSANNVVLAVLVQFDGRIVIGGGFTRLQPNGAAAPVERLRLARLEPNGTLDASFNPQADNRVTSLALLPDDSILVGGNFLNIGGTAARYLARVGSNGAVDQTFRPSPNASVEAIAVQSDGRILVGGSFAWFQPGDAGSVSYAGNFARLNPDGRVDSTFAPSVNAPVAALLVQADQRIVLGGYFTQVSGTNRRRLARIQPDGSLDAAFLPGLGGRVHALAVQPDGSVLVGGSFANIAGVSRRSLARLNAQGVLDAAFDPVIDGEVLAIALQSDGRVLLGGNFTYIDGTVQNYLARLQADGSLDTSFHPWPNGQVSSILVQPDGKILIGGGFSSLDPDGDPSDSDTLTRFYIARLNADGTVDTTFDPRANSTVNTMVLLSDGKILVGGAFTGFQPNGTGTGVSRQHLALLNSNGTVDESMATAASDTVTSIVVQSDGKIVFGGAFTALRAAGATETVTRNFLARISANGAIDTAFDPSPNGSVSALAVTSDNRIVVGGSFTQLQPNGSATAIPRSRFVWLNGDGTLDTTRISDFDAPVLAAVAQAGGAVLAGGAFSGFSTANGERVAAEDHVVKLLASGAIDPSFVPRAAAGPSGFVTALALQADGNTLAGGSFAGLGGALNQNLVRLTSGGTPDYGFYARTDGVVNAVLSLTESTAASGETSPVAWVTSEGELRNNFSRTDLDAISGGVNAAVVLPGGGLIIAGNFTNANHAGGNYISRFSATGAVDTTFSPRPDNAVYAMVRQPDGKLVLGGAFTTFGASGSTTTRSYIARLNEDGSLDTAFNPTASGTVYALRLLSDGDILVGGAFTTFQPNGATATTARSYLARLNSDGTVDTAFNPGANATVRAFAVQSDNKVIAGGDFTTVASTTRNRIARINPDGTLDAAFDPNVDGAVYSLAVQGNGQIIVSGTFTTVKPNGASTTTSAPAIARLNADGTLDATFDPQPNGYVDVAVVQADGRILIGGAFTELRPNDSAEPIRRNRVARLNSNGSVDPLFNPNADGSVLEIVVHTDGTVVLGGTFTRIRTEATVLAGGSFTTVNSEPINRLVRLNADGSHDVYYRPEPDGEVFALAAQSDQQVIVGGAFASIGGVSRGRVARLTSAGAVAPDFNPNADGPVHAVAIQPDGRILLGGTFASVGGTARQRLARVLATGAIDPSFNASADARVTALALQADGRVVVAGEFTTVNGVARRGLARLNTDGTLDASFNPSANGTVWAVAVQADGRVLAGGSFTQIGGGARSSVARLNPGGTLDETFAATVDGPVLSIAIQPDGRPLIGGSFTRLNNRSRYLVGRLPNTSPANETLTVSPDRTRITWSRSGTAPEFASVLFSFSSDNATWTNLGAATRTGAAGAWQISGLNLPAGLYYLRASAVLMSTRFASSGHVQSGWQLFGTRVAGTPAVNVLGLPTDGSSGGDPAGGTDSGGAGTGTGADDGDPATGSGSGSVSAPGGGTSAAGPLHLVNLSLRAQPAPGAPLIAGFYLAGAEPQQVVLRAVGPTLQAFGVDGTMSRPQLSLYDNTGRLLAQNDGWGGSPDLQEAFTRTGAFPLSAPNSTDAALTATLPPGAYTIHVDDTDKPSGIGLGEIYFATDSAVGGLANLSALAPVGVGLTTSITGFSLEGDTPCRVLVRAAGPALRAFGVTDAVDDPLLAIYNSDGRMIADNDNWQEQVDASASASLASTMSSAGAFAFAAGSKDAAIVIELPAGSYTVHVVAGAPGTALAEVYELP